MTYKNLPSPEQVQPLGSLSTVPGTYETLKNVIGSKKCYWFQNTEKCEKYLYRIRCL